MTILFDATVHVNHSPAFGAGVFRPLPLDADYRPTAEPYQPTTSDEGWRLEQLAREEFERWMDHVYRRELRAEAALMEMG